MVSPALCSELATGHRVTRQKPAASYLVIFSVLHFHVNLFLTPDPTFAFATRISAKIRILEASEDPPERGEAQNPQERKVYPSSRV